MSPPPGADAGRRRPDAFPLPLCVAVPVGVDPEAARALLAALPASHGVILLEAEGGEPVQLAATADLRAFAVQRLVEREGPRADLLEVTRAVRACPCGSAIEADLLLLELARERRPETAREIAERTQPWFLAIDPGAEHPVWRLTDLADPGEIGPGDRVLGPFPTRNAATDFHKSLDELFELCRFPRELKRTPGGQPCAYREMGRCPAACAGGEPLEAYRARAAEAAGCLGAARQTLAATIRGEMERATRALDFERAMLHRDRLGELDKLAKPRVAGVTDCRRLAGVLVAPSERRGFLRITLLSGGRATPFADVRRDSDDLGPLLEAAAGRLAVSTDPDLRKVREQAAALLRWTSSTKSHPALLAWTDPDRESSAEFVGRCLARLNEQKA